MMVSELGWETAIEKFHTIDSANSKLGWDGLDYGEDLCHIFLRLYNDERSQDLYDLIDQLKAMPSS